MRKIIISLHVVFDKTCFPYGDGTSATTLSSSAADPHDLHAQSPPPPRMPSAAAAASADFFYPGSCFGLFSCCGSHFGQVFCRSSHFGRVSYRGNIPGIASRAAPASHNTYPSRLVFHLPTSRVAFHTNNLYQLDSADLPLRLIPVVPPNNAHKMNTRAKSGFPCLKSILTYLYLPHSHQFLPPTV
jgi:hypothetical protein